MKCVIAAKIATELSAKRCSQRARRFANRQATKSNCNRIKALKWWPGAESNCRHADFQSDVRTLLGLYFNKLAGRPLPNLHHNA